LASDRPRPSRSAGDSVAASTAAVERSRRKPALVVNEVAPRASVKTDRRRVGAGQPDADPQAERATAAEPAARGDPQPRIADQAVVGLGAGVLVVAAGDGAAELEPRGRADRGGDGAERAVVGVAVAQDRAGEAVA
jgi:hypothetical protein